VVLGVAMNLRADVGNRFALGDCRSIIKDFA